MSAETEANGQSGPLSAATLVVRDLSAALHRYAALGLHPRQRYVSDAAMARAWGDAGLAERQVVWLGAAGGPTFLRLIECPEAQRQPPLVALGHFALELNSADLQRLATHIPGSGFRHLGGPAALDFSDAVLAMQVAGDDGEVLYLTEIVRPLQPFELPQTSLLLDSLFIAVLAVADRAASLAFYERLAGRKGLAFETRIRVINGLLQRDADTRCAAATVQLDGESLFEIDELPELPRITRALSQRSGIAWITLQADLAALRLSLRIGDQCDPLLGSAACAMLQGPSGEWLELIATAPRSQ